MVWGKYWHLLFFSEITLDLSDIRGCSSARYSKIASPNSSGTSFKKQQEGTGKIYKRVLHKKGRRMYVQTLDQ